VRSQDASAAAELEFGGLPRDTYRPHLHVLEPTAYSRKVNPAQLSQLQGWQPTLKNLPVGSLD